MTPVAAVGSEERACLRADFIRHDHAQVRVAQVVKERAHRAALVAPVIVPRGRRARTALHGGGGHLFPEIVKSKTEN